MMTIDDLGELFGECRFKVGDFAYYRLPELEYSVRKARVCGVEKKENRRDRLSWPTGEKAVRFLNFFCPIF